MPRLHQHRDTLAPAFIPSAPHTRYVIVRQAVTAKKIKVAQVEKPKKGKK